MRLRVIHTTRYTYATPASDSHNEVRLMPLSDRDQTCLDFRLTTRPPSHLSAYDLPSGRVHKFNVMQPHNELTITAESLVVTHRTNPFASLQLISDDTAYYQDENVRQRYYEYLAPTKRVPLDPETDRIAAVARKQAGVGTASFLIALIRVLHRVFAYAPGTTNVNTSITQVLENRQGVCQDFTHLMLSICRRQGIPARYVSGYLYTGAKVRRPGDEESYRGFEEREAVEMREAENEKRSETTQLLGGDATHAWVECLMPDEQWCGFDPTNNLVTNDHYVKMHFGRDYGDVTPVRGVYRGPAEHTLDVAVLVVQEEL